MILILGFKRISRWFSNIFAKFRKTKKEEVLNKEKEPEKTEKTENKEK